MKSAFLNIRVSQLCFNHCKHCYMKKSLDEKINLEDVTRFLNILKSEGYTKIKVTLIGGEISALDESYIGELLDVLDGCYVRIVTAMNYKSKYQLIYKEIYEKSVKWIEENGFENTDMDQPIVYSTNLSYVVKPESQKNLEFHKTISDNVTINLVYESNVQLKQLLFLTNHAARHCDFKEVKINLLPNKNIFYGKTDPINNEKLNRLYKAQCEEYGFLGRYSWHFDGRKCINQTAESKNFFVINPTGEILPCAYYPYDMKQLEKHYANLHINNINDIESIKEIFEGTLYTDYYSNLQNCSLGKCPIENVYTGANHG